MLPISIGEMMRLDFKLMTMRCVVALPAAICLGPYVVWLTGFGQAKLALGYGLLAIWSLLASRPIASSWCVAGGCTRPSGRLGRRALISLMKWSVVILYLLLTVGAAVAVHYSTLWLIGMCLAQASLGVGYALWFARIYNRCWVSAETRAAFESGSAAD